MKTMKKTYLNPEIEILEADDLLLLTVSITDDTTGVVITDDGETGTMEGRDGFWNDWNEE